MPLGYLYYPKGVPGDDVGEVDLTPDMMLTVCQSFRCVYSACQRIALLIMSGSKPDEMAPESSRAVVMPKFDMHTYTSILTTKELKEVITEYCIPTDLHPRLPPPGLTMGKLLPNLPTSRVVLHDQRSRGEGADYGRLLQLPVWNGTVVSKGDPLPENQRPQLRTTPPLAVGEPIPKKRGSVVQRKKRDRKNQEPTNTGSEGTISITPLHQVAPKTVDKPITSAPKNTTGDATVGVRTTDVEKEVVVISENTRVPTPPVIVTQPSPHAEDADSQEHVASSNARSFHSAHHEGDDESTTELLGVTIRPWDDVCYRRMQANFRLSKQLSLLETVHSSYSDTERELADRLKDLEKERDDRKETASGQKIRVLEEEKNSLVAQLAQAEMDRQKIIKEFIPIVVHRLHTSVEYRKSLVAPVVTDSYLLSLDDLMKVSPDVPAPAEDITRPSTENGDAGLVGRASPKVHTAGTAIGTSPRTTT
ncbi:hypothetical protein Tco_1562357 [Tanacetum coccineum]